MGRKVSFPRSTAAALLLAFLAGVLLQKFVGLGRLLPRPERSGSAAPADTLRYDAPVPPAALAAFGEPAAPFPPESVYVYSTGPERDGTGRAAFSSYRYAKHYREVAARLASPEAKERARRARERFWADRTGRYATQRKVLREALGVAEAPPAGRVITRAAVGGEGTLLLSRLEMESRIDSLSFPVCAARPADRAPAAVVIAVHGHSGAPEKVIGLEPRDYTRAFGAELARAGYAVFAPYVLGVSRLNANIHGLGLLYSRNTKYSVDLQKLLALVDHVHADPELAGLPLAVYGISYGGRLALLLAALDDRVDAVVASGAMKYSPAWLEEHYRLENDVYWANETMWNRPYPVLFLFQDLARLVAPRPLLLETGAYDLFGRSASMVEEIRAVRRAYAAAGGERFETVWFRGYHETAPSLVVPVLDRMLFPGTAGKGHHPPENAGNR